MPESFSVVDFIKSELFVNKVYFGESPLSVTAVSEPNEVPPRGWEILKKKHLFIKSKTYAPMPTQVEIATKFWTEGPIFSTKNW